MNEKKLRKKQQPKNKKQKQKTRQIMPPEIPVHRNEKNPTTSPLPNPLPSTKQIVRQRHPPPLRVNILLFAILNAVYADLNAITIL